MKKFKRIYEETKNYFFIKKVIADAMIEYFSRQKNETIHCFFVLNLFTLTCYNIVM